MQGRLSQTHLASCTSLQSAIDVPVSDSTKHQKPIDATELFSSPAIGVVFPKAESPGQVTVQTTFSSTYCCMTLGVSLTRCMPSNHDRTSWAVIGLDMGFVEFAMDGRIERCLKQVSSEILDGISYRLERRYSIRCSLVNGVSLALCQLSSTSFQPHSH